MEKTGEKNAYVCEKCHQQFITVVLMDGTTPFMTKCRAKWPDKCEGMAQSQMYRIDQSLAASWGWHSPQGAEREQLIKMHPEMKDYLESGCLVLRRLDSAERDTYGHRVRHG